MSPLEQLRAAAADPEAAARAHKAEGGRVIAFLCDNVPIELIVASGFFPLRIRGRPAVRTGKAERVVDRLYPPDVTQRPEFVASMLDLILDGGADMADALIVPHNRNAVQAMHRELRDAAKAEGLALPETWYLDKAWAPGGPSKSYDEAAIHGLVARLEGLAGRAMEQSALLKAVKTVNAARNLVGRAGALRGMGLSGSDFHAIASAFWALPAAHFIELTEAALTEVESTGSAPRIYLGGSPQDHAGLYDIVAQVGATIVTEDHCWGVRVADGVLPGEIPPLDAIVARFHTYPACSIRFPLQRTIDANLERARRAQVDGAIFAVAARDAVQAWETPEQIAAFKAAGIPTLHLRNQPYATNSETSDAIAQFIEGLRS